MMDIRILTLGYMRKNGQTPPAHMSFAEQDALVSGEPNWGWQLAKRLLIVVHNVLTSLLSLN